MKRSVSFVVFLLFVTAAAFAGIDPDITTFTVSDTEIDIILNWSTVPESNHSRYVWGLYRAKSENESYVLKKVITPNIDNVIQVSNLEPGVTYYFRISHGLQSQQLPFTLKPGKAQSVTRTKNENTSAKKTSKPISQTYTPPVSVSVNEGVYVGLLSFAGGIEELTRKTSGGGGLFQLDSAGRAAFHELIKKGYTASNEFGTSLYYGVHKALANMTEQEQQGLLPKKIDSVTLITFTDGLDTSSTDVMLPVLEGKDFHAPRTISEYRDYVSSEVKSRLIGGVNISAYSFGLRGRDIANETDFIATLQSITSSPENASPISGVQGMASSLDRIAADFDLNQIDPRVRVRISLPAYSVGTTIRITFDSPTGGVVNAKNYIECQAAWKDGRYALDNFSSFGEIAVVNTDSIIGERNRQAIDYNFIVNRNFYAQNVRQWTLPPDGNSNNWQINSEFQIDKREGFSHERSSALIYFVLDSSSSLSQSNIQAIRDAITGFVDKIYDKTAKELYIPVVGQYTPPTVASNQGASTWSGNVSYPQSSPEPKTPARKEQPVMQVPKAHQRPAQNADYQNAAPIQQIYAPGSQIYTNQPYITDASQGFPEQNETPIPLPYPAQPGYNQAAERLRPGAAASFAAKNETASSSDRVQLGQTVPLQPEGQAGQWASSRTSLPAMGAQPLRQASSPMLPPSGPYNTYPPFNSNAAYLTGRNSAYAGYWVQVGAYQESSLAERSNLVLKQNGISNATIFQSKQNGENWYMTRVGPYASQEEAAGALQGLRGSPFRFTDSFIVVLQ